MEHRRKVQRHRAKKAGSIKFRHTNAFGCRVRNLSPAGACLEVPSRICIPDEFVLVVGSERLLQPCHAIWRTATRLGVEFHTI
jgi:hypothetical protein